MKHSLLTRLFLATLAPTACVAVMTLTTSSATAQSKIDDLVGTWVGTSAANRGEKVIVGRDHVVLSGTRMPLRLVGPGVLEIGPRGESERLAFQLAGDVLTIRESDATTTWRRAGKKPTSRPKQNDVSLEDNPLEDNPLDEKVVDPFAREFRGDGIRLALTGSAASGYRGTLTFRGKQFPAKARAEGKSLRGSFHTNGKDYPFTAMLSGNEMKLASGRSQYRLTGAKQSDNPLDDNPLSDKPRNDKSLEKVEPRHMPGTKLLVDKGAGVACRVPQTWSVLKGDQTGCVLNPGFAKGQTLDVTVSLHCLPLDANVRGMSPAKLLTSELDSTRRSLQQSGITTQAPAKGVQATMVGGKPAAYVVMQARTAQGRQGIVWVAVRIAGDKCLAINSIFLDGKESTYLAPVKYAFETLVPASEAREPAPLPATPGKGVMMLKKREFRDPGFGGIVSHRMYLPADWRGDAGVRWTNARSNFAHFVGSFEGPDHTSITYDYNRYFGNSTFKSSLDQIRMNVAADRSGYSLVAWPPTRRGQVAAQYIIPKLRPGAQNIRIVGVKTFPKAEAALRQQLAPIIQQLSPGHTMDLGVQRVHLTYEQGGRQWEEYVQYAIAINKVMFRSQYVNSDTGLTEVSGVRTFRAPSGRLAQEFPKLRKVADTLRPTPQWSLSLAKLNMEISRIRHKGRMQAIAQYGKRARTIAQTYSEISDIQMSGWRKRQASQDRIQKASVNSILDVHDYTSRSGSQIALDNSYDRVFEDALGNVIMTNDPSYDPSTDPRRANSNWKQLQRIRHLGR